MSNAVSNQSRALGHDGRAVKLVLVDTQNIPKLGPRKTAPRRNVNVGINRGNNGGYPTVLKPSRQRRKPGMKLLSKNSLLGGGGGIDVEA